MNKILQILFHKVSWSTTSSSRFPVDSSPLGLGLKTTRHTQSDLKAHLTWMSSFPYIHSSLKSITHFLNINISYIKYKLTRIFKWLLFNCNYPLNVYSWMQLTLLLHKTVSVSFWIFVLSLIKGNSPPVWKQTVLILKDNKLLKDSRYYWHDNSISRY